MKQIATLFLLSTLACAQNIVKRGIDLSNSSSNPSETVLTPANVGQLQKLYTVKLEGEIYAQPLYVSGVNIGGVVHNLIIVATMKSEIFVIDADTLRQIWMHKYGTPIVTNEVQDPSYPNINSASTIGILSTPVIDTATDILYFVSADEPTPGTYTYLLQAVDIRDGTRYFHTPVTIAGNYTTADGTFTFVPKLQKQRAGLVEANGNIYIAFASYADQGPYHGWIFAYSANGLKQVAVYMDTTTGGHGGIWMAGSAPAVDERGNLYFSTGNGEFENTASGLPQTGNSFIKLSPTLQLLDRFTPYNSEALNAGDEDLGASSVVLIPNPTTGSAQYAVGGGKPGILYVSDVNNMGGFNASGDLVAQEFQAIFGSGTSHIHGTPAFFNQSLYVWGENDVLRRYPINSATGLLSTTTAAVSSMTAPVTHAHSAMPGGFITISSNAGSNAVLWASTPFNGNAMEQNVQGVVYAFDPGTLQVLWSDSTYGMFAKYVPPVVANGRVYLANFGPVGTTGADGQLIVYGLHK